MILGGDARAADAAVWRRADVEPRSGGFRRIPPLLAVEVSGRDEGELELHAESRLVSRARCANRWLVLPASQQAVIVTNEGSSRRSGDAVLSADALPGLAIAVSALFAQL